jgi:hypothetical protein
VRRSHASLHFGSLQRPSPASSITQQQHTKVLHDNKRCDVSIRTYIKDFSFDYVLLLGCDVIIYNAVIITRKSVNIHQRICLRLPSFGWEKPEMYRKGVGGWVCVFHGD